LLREVNSKKKRKKDRAIRGCNPELQVKESQTETGANELPNKGREDVALSDKERREDKRKKRKVFSQDGKGGDLLERPKLSLLATTQKEESCRAKGGRAKRGLKETGRKPSRP